MPQTLLIVGSESPTIFHKIIKALIGTRSGNSRSDDVEHADHFLTLTAHEQFNRRIMEFWSAYE